MSSPAVQVLETLLQQKKFAGTLARPREAARVLASGLPLVDERIGGGWPLGAISEVVGARSSGRTGVLLATLAAAAARGQVVALVDTLDRLDPRSAADAGLDVSRVLWVRGAPLTIGTARPALIDQAIRQGLRACDLILRAGGFAVVALDLCDIPPRRLQAVPAVTWLRLAHANEGRDTVGLLGSDVPIGRSARGVSVRIEATACWSGASAQARRLSGFTPAITPRWAGSLKGGPLPVRAVGGRGA